MASFGISKLDSPMVHLDSSVKMLSQSSPIGIFDSGVGGLTVLKEVSRQLPQESIVYFGDTARLPYGDRSPAEILQYVREILNWMTTQGVKMVIMACNTSSALALDLVAKEYPFPILGVISYPRHRQQSCLSPRHSQTAPPGQGLGNWLS
jgi:glutamate racemase